MGSLSSSIQAPTDPLAVVFFLRTAMTNERMESLRDFVTKWVVPAGAVIVVFSAAFTVMTYIIRAEVAGIRSDIGVLQNDVTTINRSLDDAHSDLSGTNQKIDGLLKDALERAFPRPGGGKTKVISSLQDANSLLRLAKAQNIKLSPPLIAAYGKEVSNLVGDPAVSKIAWQGLSTILDYRSFLNGSDAPNPTDVHTQPPEPQTGGPPTDYWFTNIEARPRTGTRGTHTMSLTIQTVPTDLAARYEKIGDTINKRKQYGPAQMIFDGHDQLEIRIDDHWLKNIVIRNVWVEYDGGPVILDNVYFVNCTFQIVPQHRGQQFAKAILEMPSIVFNPS